MSNKLELNEKEFELIKRQVDRLYEHKSRIKPREVRRKEMEYKLLKGLQSRLIKPGVQMLNRNDIRAIEGLCNVGSSALKDLILPGYKERLTDAGTDTAMQEHYKGYIERAELTLGTYNAILLKLESFL